MGPAGRAACSSSLAQAQETQQQPDSSHIYDRPQLYDDAFSYRDFAAEAKFLLGAYQQHSQPGGKLQTALELGCGPANHAVQLAKRKVKTWVLDSNTNMLQFAQQKAASAGVALIALQDDMASFEVQGMQGRFDLVTCLLGTLSHLLDNKSAAKCFRCVADHLRPGGLFVIELAHPGDLFDGSLLLQDTGAEMWEVDKPSGKLMVVWGTDVDMFDPQTQILDRTVSIHTMNGEEMDECLLEEVVPYRQFTAQEIDLLAAMSGMEVAGVYGDLDLDVGLTHEDAFRMVELGLDEAANALQQSCADKPKQPRKKREKLPAEAVEARRSGRERKEVNYAEFDRASKGEGPARPPVDYTERIKACTLTSEEAEKLRVEMESKKGRAGGKARGPIDSGKGVRIQGGRVYDSKHGVTCHWCRQKTLEDHVTCTNSNCGNGRRMPLSFCAKCLRNRHGEDFEAAEASGEWWCPACRGSCGPGCVICCNCGPCRKKAGLEPTHQVVKLARDAGFCNVHDYLVHLVTDEDAETIAARKLAQPWGSWLKQDSSDASEQTAGGAGGCEPEQDEAAAEGNSKQQQPNKDCCKHSRDTAVTDFFRASKPTSCRNPSAKAAAGKSMAGSRKRKAAAAEADAAAEASGKQQQQQDAEDEELLMSAEDAPLLSSQDTKLSRKQRIMQQMGLAAVTVV
eukprot:gene1683-2027_t